MEVCIKYICFVRFWLKLNLLLNPFIFLLSNFQVRIQQLGPGMVSQVQSMCGECRGQGERINPKDKCKTCEGKKVS